MSANLEQIEQEVLALPPKERARLVEKLWEGLGDTTCPELGEEWKAEIERRCREIDEGTAQMIPGEQVFREVHDLLQSMRRK